MVEDWSGISGGGVGGYWSRELTYGWMNGNHLKNIILGYIVISRMNEPNKNIEMRYKESIENQYKGRQND